MDKKYNVLYVTGSRAEYGIMSKLLVNLDAAEKVNLDIVITGTHLYEKFGSTSKYIYQDALNVVDEIYLPYDNDSNRLIGEQLSILTNSLTKIFDKKKYDLVIILGDRYEMLPVANLSIIYGYPICHLHGGETTLGNYDEFIRNAISKMSHIHLVSTDEHKKRLVKMGENPNAIANVGALGVHNVINRTIFSSKELEKQVSVRLEEEYYVFLMHTETLLQREEMTKNIENVFSFLNKINKQVIFIGSNSDTNNSLLSDKIAEFVNKRTESFVFNSLSSDIYHGLVANSKGIIGNSSSGLIEVPSLGVPTLNIGNRQKGRVSGPSVIHSDYQIENLITKFKEMKDVSDFTNPYFKENACDLATEFILCQLDKQIIMEKIFYE